VPVIRVDMGECVAGERLEGGMGTWKKHFNRGFKTAMNGMSYQKNAAIDRVINDIAGLQKDDFYLIVSTGALRARLNVLMAHIKDVVQLFSVGDNPAVLKEFDETSNVTMMYNVEKVKIIQSLLTDIYDIVNSLDSVKKVPAFVISLSAKYNEMAAAAVAGTILIKNVSDGVTSAYTVPITHCYPVLI
jgi:hypothetical protein